MDKPREMAASPAETDDGRSHRWFRNYGWRLIPGGAIALGCAVLFKLGVFSPLEELAYTSLFQLRGARPWDDRLVLIKIDDPSIQAIGRFPWSRQQYVKLLEVLTKADPGVVVVDLVFSEPSPDDQQLAKAMTRYGRVVLARAPQAGRFGLAPVNPLQQSAITTGHILFNTDSLDGVTRSVPTMTQGLPTLGVATLQAYSLTHEHIPLPALSDRLWINWTAPVQTLPQYSFVDVVQGKVSPQAFRNKIVFVGVTASAIDPMITPYNRDFSASGVHLHVAIVDNLLKRNLLHQAPSAWLPVLFLLCGPGFGIAFSFCRQRLQLLSWLGACLGWVGLALLGFWANLWLPIALPLVLLTATAAATRFNYRLRTNSLLQQQIQQLWQTYHLDLVAPPTETDQAVTTLEQGGNSSTSIEQLTTLAEQFGRSQSTQAAIANNLPVGLLVADLDGIIWFCNPVATQWLNAHLGDYLNTCLIPTWFTESEWHTTLQQLKQQEWVAPKLLQQTDRWYELKLEFLVDKPQFDFPKPQLSGLLVVVTDLTTQKQAELILAEQVQELRRLSQLKDDFLSTVSHELRAPMTNIQMAIKLLEISKSPESAAQYLKILQTECDREVELINDLLDLQRLEAGAQTFTAEPIHLTDWLPSIIEGFYERAEAQQQILQLELPAHLPTLLGDRAGLERVIVELVNNACKYTPPHEHIKVSATSTATDLQLIVCNSGVEIPSAEMSRIFEKFYRVPQSDPWKRGGTGLGLALVKKLVECMGGSIAVSSCTGETAFTISLPLN